jgi:hypothetical protein
MRHTTNRYTGGYVGSQAHLVHQSPRKKIDPKAKEIAIIKGEPDDWKEYIDRAAELLGIQPQEKWVVDYSDQDGRHIETFKLKKDAEAREAQVTR